MTKTVTEVIYQNKFPMPINYTWPDKVSYYDPITGIKEHSEYYRFWFKLQSGAKSDSTSSDCGYKELDWSKINFI